MPKNLRVVDALADQMPTSDVPVCQAAGYTVHSVLWFGTSGKAECYVFSVSALGQQDWARPALKSGRVYGNSVHKHRPRGQWGPSSRIASPPSPMWRGLLAPSMWTAISPRCTLRRSSIELSQDNLPVDSVPSTSPRLPCPMYEQKDHRNQDPHRTIWVG